LLLNCSSSCFRNIALQAYWDHEFDLSGPRDVIDHVPIRLSVGHFLLVVLRNQPLSLTVSEIFNSECDAMVDMTLNDLYAKAKVIHLGTNRFLKYEFPWAVNSNFCSRTHRV